ncbi:MAG: pyridoxamine 5'-phosphate oxidase [Bdellovibrionales bacterium]|nr:pyridoxamine 5'-phosphate oxidase [Bdellovibrionales bacterium]
MNINETLENLRGSYRQAAFDITDCNSNPELQFDSWFENAVNSKCDEPNAFVLSTIADNRPRARVVLLKGIHQSKFIFYTNYSSAKGHELDNNANVALTFLWLPLQRQVRIEGTINKVDPHLSDDYFHKRPRGNQIGAIASPQSQKVSSRAELEKFFHEAEKNSTGQAVLLRPAHWGGYAIDPTYFEFWQGRDNRMHDRIVYEKNATGWTLSRLAP